MNQAAETGAGPARDTGAVSGQIQITIEAIRKIARDNMAQMQDNAHSRSSDFRGLSVPPSAFGDVPVAAAVGQQHQAAHDLFMDTINGVIADLQTFATNLEESCTAHERADQGSADATQRAGQGALTEAATSMGAHQYQSDQNFAETSAERRDELGQVSDDQLTDGPGQSGEAPGQSGEAPGQSGEAPGQSGEAPGQSGAAPAAGGFDNPTGSPSGSPSGSTAG